MRRAIAVGAATVLALGGATLLAGTASAEESSTECVPVEAQDAVPATYETVENPDYVPAVEESTTTETTDWLTEPPEGDGWEVVDERTVTDTEAVPPVVKYKYKRWVETTYKTVPNPDYVAPSTEVIPAQGEPTIEVVDTPAWTEEVHHEAEGYTEYKFVHKFDFFHLNPKWKTDPNWNAEGNPHSKGWIRVGERFVETKAAWTEYVEHPATYKEVPNPDYVPEQVIEHPAVGEETIEVVDVEGHWDYQWFDTEQDEPWVFVREKVKVPGQDAVTHQEYRYERDVVVPGSPAVGEPTIQVETDPGKPAVEAVECPMVPEQSKPVIGTAVSVTADVPEEPVLAETGSNGLGVMGVLAGALTLAGGVLVAGRKFAHR